MIASEIYLNLLESLNTQEKVKLELHDQAMIKINENLIKAMIRVTIRIIKLSYYLINKFVYSSIIKDKRPWKEIENKCMQILSNFNCVNESALGTLLELYEELRLSC
jgi:hypothetical protein